MKQRGPTDITICKIGELKTYVAQKGFTRANLAALVASSYCPMATLNAIYSNLAWAVNRHILINSPAELKWADKIHPKFNDLIIKLTYFYFKTQQIPQVRYAFLSMKPEDFDIYVIAFSDGAEEFATSAVYIVSTAKNGLNMCKAHLATTASKIQNVKIKSDNPDTVPKHECDGSNLAASSMKKVCDLIIEAGFKITKVILAIDAISVILAIAMLPAKFRRPF